MFDKFKNLNIVQWLLFYFLVSILILICLFDRDISIYNQIKLVNQKNGFQYISKHYDYYKLKYNINDFECYIRDENKSLATDSNGLISLYFGFDSDYEINQWIKKNPKSYSLIKEIEQDLINYDKNKNLCITNNNKEEEPVFLFVLKEFEKTKEDKINKFNNGEILFCKNNNDNNIRVSKKMSYNITKTKENIYYIYKKEAFYNLNFCE